MPVRKCADRWYSPGSLDSDSSAGSSSNDECDTSQEYETSISVTDSGSEEYNSDTEFEISVDRQARHGARPVAMQLRVTVSSPYIPEPLPRSQMGALLRDAAQSVDDKSEAIKMLLEKIPQKNPTTLKGTSCFTCCEQVACVLVSPCNHITSCAKCMHKSARMFQRSTQQIPAARPTCFICRVKMQDLRIVDVSPTRMCRGTGCSSSALVLCNPCSHAYGCMSCVQNNKLLSTQTHKRRRVPSGTGYSTLRCLKPECDVKPVSTTPLIFS